MPPPTIDDPYAVLGIPPDSSEADVKKAYRKLALKYHPDRQNGKSEEEAAEASAMFVKIAEAQDILTDPVKRYDFRMKQEAKQNKSNVASAAAAAAAKGGKPGAPQPVRRSPTRPSSVRKKSPVPPNRQASIQSMRRGLSPRSMNRKQGSVRVGQRPSGGAGFRTRSDPPRRVNSAGALPNPRSLHGQRGGPNRPSVAANATFNVNKAPPTGSNRSKTAQLLRTPSSASVASKRPKPEKKPESGDQDGATSTFVRNNGKTPLKKTPSATNGKNPPKKTKSSASKVDEEQPKKKKKKKKKKAVEDEQTFTFVRNNTSTKPAGKVKKPKNGDSASVMKKKKVKQTSARPSSFRGGTGMLSPQQAPRKSVLSFSRPSMMSPQSTKSSKKRTAGIKSFLGRAPLEKD